MPTEKKRIITSYSKLSEDLERLFKQTYPKGYEHAVVTINKPNGETIYAVRLETDDTSYLVRVEVKIGDFGDDEDDGDYEGEEPDLDGSEQYGEEEEEDKASGYEAYGD